MTPALTEGMAIRQATKERGEFGYWLYDARTSRGQTQEVLADAADVHVTYVSQLELGKKSPSRKVVTSLARALVPADLDSSEAEESYRRLLAEGLAAAGFAGEGYQYPEASPGYSIIREAGYDSQQFAPEDVEDIRRSVEIIIEGHIAQKRKREGRE